MTDDIPSFLKAVRPLRQQKFPAAVFIVAGVIGVAIGNYMTNNPDHVADATIGLQLISLGIFSIVAGLCWLVLVLVALFGPKLIAKVRNRVRR